MSRIEHTKRLLLESEENRVDELDVFEVVVDHVVKFESLRGGLTMPHHLWV